MLLAREGVAEASHGPTSARRGRAETGVAAGDWRSPPAATEGVCAWQCSASPGCPVPPSGYGGIEWIVSLLADALADAGHDVTLFASGDSRTRAKLAAVFEEAPSERIGQTFWELQHALNCFARHEDFDVIHDHTGLMGLALGSLLSTPLVHTVHGPVTGHPGDLYEQVVRMAPHAKLISLSLSQRDPSRSCRGSRTCPTRSTSPTTPTTPSGATTCSSSAG